MAIAVGLSTLTTAPTTASSELPAAPHTAPTAARQEMGDVVDLRSESNIHPATAFEADSQAHYPQTTYPYPRNHEPYAMEGDLQMVDAMSQEMQDPMSRPQQHSRSIGQVHPQPAPDGPGMAPPQTPHQQSFPSPTGGQSSMENLPDAGGMSEDRKRKRSKVSRACDECRRKKIRCDATDDDGSVKTCSNCSRVQQTCSFSRVPMKRGPSKGYIKELSERVQQVESQIGMSGQPGFRQSIDGSSGYPESAYSPDEPPSLKRGYSFSDAKNPFAQTQFTEREKMPGVGGWNSFSSAGATAAPQPRDSRGSIPIAPDQQSPEVSTSHNGPVIQQVPPFWAREDDEMQSERRSKRQERASEETVELLATLTPEPLTTYANTIHLTLPILPLEIDHIFNALRVCPSQLQHAFLDVLSIVQNRGRREVSIFADYPALEDYVWSEASKRLGHGQHRQNVVWTWLYLLMAIHAEEDSRTGLPVATLTRLAIDVASETLTYAKEQQSTTKAVDESTTEHIRRSFNCAAILSRLYSLGTKGFDHVPRQLEDDVGVFAPGSSLPAISLLLARLSNTLSLLIDLIYRTTLEDRPSPSTISYRRSIEKHIAFVLGSTPQSVELQIIGNQYRLFAGIILARTTNISDPAEILTPALTFANSLSLSAATATYNPLEIHFFTLTAVTLLEFATAIDDQLAERARTGLPKLQHALEAISQRKRIVAGDEAMHWSESLARLLKARSESTGNGINSTSYSNDDRTATIGQSSTMSIPEARDYSGHDGQGDKFVDDKTSLVQVVDFQRLLRTGYLVVFEQLCRS